MLDVTLLTVTSYLISSMNLATSLPKTSTGLSNQKLDQKFAVIIDAGSSGSRMFVYTWKQDKEEKEILPKFEIFTNSNGVQIVKKTTPGLSSFAEKINEISDYISMLLDFASKEIPSAIHGSTPVYIFATAGMRLLSDGDQEKVWVEVRRVVASKYTFKFTDSNARTITGKEEALFGWIAVNYLLDRFDFDDTGTTKKLTHGMLDMGGASMQIAFELSVDQKKPQESIIQFSLPSSIPSKWLHYQIYLVSYLNFGANVMRRRYEQLLLHQNLNPNKIDHKQNKLEIGDECLLNGLKRVSKNIVPRSAEDIRPADNLETKYEVSFRGNGDYAACGNSIKPIFGKRFDCEPLPCAVGATVQAQIDYQNMKFYGLTEFFYSFTDLMNDGVYRHDTVLTKTRNLCAEQWNTYEASLRKANAGKPPNTIEEIVQLKKLACFKAAYLILMIHFGLNFPTNYTGLHPITHLDGTEVQWSMGALVYLLNAVPGSDHWPPYLIAMYSLFVLFVIALVIMFILLIRYKHKCCKKISTGDAELLPDMPNSTPVRGTTTVDKNTLDDQST